jgi:hypothetical protein
MSNDKGKVAESVKPAAVNDGFVDVVTERGMYKPDTCKETPLQGYLINKIPMPPQRGRAWNAFLVRITAPCLVEDRDGNVTTAPIGSEVLIPGTYALEGALTRAALATIIHEVRIIPLKRNDIGGGQSLWSYKIQAKKDGVERDRFGFSAMLGEPAEVPQLTAGGSSDNIPF